MYYSKLTRDVYSLQNASTYGGKAASLANLTIHGIYNIPPWAGVPAWIYHQTVGYHMGPALSLIDNHLYDSAFDAAKTIIMRQEVDVTLLKELEHFTTSTLPANTLSAVRSSAIEEDGNTASFAGQHDSYLGLTPPKIYRAILKCWASMFNPRALEYRQAMGLNPYPTGMGVIVQKMIKPTISGVGFSADPTNTLPNTMVIEAILGLGELLVSGQVDPTLYFLDRNSYQVIHKEARTQNLRLGLRMAGGTRRSRIKDLSVHFPPALLNRLARSIVRIEGFYQFPVDVEWAIKGSSLYILQARPLTTIAGEDEGGGRVNANPGQPASPGQAIGTVTQMVNQDSHFPGGILLAETTSPDYLSAMRAADGIITIRGGVTCHAAIVARELKIPCIVGVGTPTAKKISGKRVRMDGSTGEIEVMDEVGE